MTCASCIMEYDVYVASFDHMFTVINKARLQVNGGVVSEIEIYCDEKTHTESTKS